jgi:hypothetical protein
MKVTVLLPTGETAVSDTSQLTLKYKAGAGILLCLGQFIIATFEEGYLMPFDQENRTALTSFGLRPKELTLSPKQESEIANVTAISVEES